MAKSVRPKGVRIGGRNKGTPNRLTSDIRQCFADIMQNMGPRMEEWIERVAETDPGRAAEIILKLAEYHIPKLSRSIISGDKENPIQFVVVSPDQKTTEMIHSL